VVKGPAGERLPGATVEVRRGSCDGPAVWRTTTTSNPQAFGAFGVSLAPGAYCVIPLAAPAGYSVSKSSMFSVVSGPGNWHTVWLPSLVSGAVAAKTGVGDRVNDVGVLISRGSCVAPEGDVWAQTTSTNRWSSGSFGISLAPGVYCVRATWVPEGYATPEPREVMVVLPWPACITVWLQRL